MNYRLYEKESNTGNIINDVLINRGINNPETYLNLNESVIIPYQKLDNIENAVQLFMKQVHLPIMLVSQR